MLSHGSRAAFLCLGLGLLAPAIAAEKAPAAGFKPAEVNILKKDAPTPVWANRDVQRAFDFGILNPANKDNFKGAKDFTRFMAAEMGNRMYEKYINGKGFEDVVRKTELTSVDGRVRPELESISKEYALLKEEARILRAEVDKAREANSKAKLVRTIKIIRTPKPEKQRFLPWQRMAIAPDIFLPTDGDLDKGVGWTVDYALGPRTRPGFTLGAGQLKGMDIPSTGDTLDADRLSLSYLFRSRTQRGLNYGIGADYYQATLNTPAGAVEETFGGYHVRALWPIGRRILTEIRYQEASLTDIAPGRVTPDLSGTSLRLYYLLGK